MPQAINTNGPSYKAGYADGYDVAQSLIADAHATADEAYSRGFKQGQEAAREAWKEWFATLPPALAAAVGAHNQQRKAA